MSPLQQPPVISPLDAVRAVIAAERNWESRANGQSQGKKSTERETLLRDMRAVRDSIDFDKIEMASGNWKATERKELLEHMVRCIKKLQKLHKTLKTPR